MPLTTALHCVPVHWVQTLKTTWLTLCANTQTAFVTFAFISLINTHMPVGDKQLAYFFFYRQLFYIALCTLFWAKTPVVVIFHHATAVYVLKIQPILAEHISVHCANYRTVLVFIIFHKVAGLFAHSVSHLQGFLLMIPYLE